MLVCSLAALLALVDQNWLPRIDLDQGTGPISTGVTINGTRVSLDCHGRGTSSAILIGAPLVEHAIDEATQTELARYVRLCTLTVSEGASRHDVPDLPDVLPGLLIGGNVPAPYVIVSRASTATATEWVTGSTAHQVAGFVVIAPPDQPPSLVVSAQGDQWPLPVNDRTEQVLAILSLFWPSDDR